MSTLTLSFILCPLKEREPRCREDCDVIVIPCFLALDLRRKGNLDVERIATPHKLLAADETS